MAQCPLIIAFGKGSCLFPGSSVPLSRSTQGLLDTPLLPHHQGMDIIPNSVWYRLLFILAQHRARHWQVFLSCKHVYTCPSSLKHPERQQSYKANCSPFLSLTLRCCCRKLVLPEWGSLSLVLHKNTINCSSCSRALERLKVRGNHSSSLKSNCWKRTAATIPAKICLSGKYVGDYWQFYQWSSSG